MKQKFNRLIIAVDKMVMRYMMLLILSLMSLNVYSQSVEFSEKHADSINVKPDSVLILGMGSTPTRIFLDDLTNKLIKEFKKRNIIVSYFFLGEDAYEAKKEFAAINKTGYKALLWLLPKGLMYFNTDTYIRRGSGYNSVTGIRMPDTKHTILRYKQSFNFQFYQRDKNNESFWSANVDVDCVPGKKGVINTLADKLFDTFKKNNYIP